MITSLQQVYLVTVQLALFVKPSHTLYGWTVTYFIIWKKTKEVQYQGKCLRILKNYLQKSNIYGSSLWRGRISDIIALVYKKGVCVWENGWKDMLTRGCLFIILFRLLFRWAWIRWFIMERSGWPETGSIGIWKLFWIGRYRWFLNLQEFIFCSSFFVPSVISS